MVEIGAALILLVFAALACIFIYFGVDDKNPAAFLLGIVFLVGMFVIIGK